MRTAWRLAKRASPCPKPARPFLTFGNLPATLSPDKRIGSHCSLFVKRQRGDVNSKHGRLASRMGRSRIGWALSVAAPWCVAFAVLVSITAEAEQEPTEFISAFARSQLISAPSRLDRAGLAARPLRAVDEDGAPLPIVQARYWSATRDDARGGRRRERAERGAEAARTRVSRRRSRRQGRSGFQRSRRQRETPQRQAFGRRALCRTSRGRARSKIRATTNSIPAIR